MYFGEICDILWYHRFSEVSFSADYLNESAFLGFEGEPPMEVQ
jgi:hypothetical protein